MRDRLVGGVFVLGERSRRRPALRRLAVLLLALAAVIGFSAPAASAKSGGPKPINIAGSWSLTGHFPSSDDGEEEEEDEEQTFGTLFFDKQHVGGGFGGQTFSFSSGAEIGNVQGTISGSSVSFGIVYAPVTDEEFVETAHFTGSVTANGQTMTGSMEIEEEIDNCRTDRLRERTENSGGTCEVKTFDFPAGKFKAERLERVLTEEEEIEKKEAREEKEEEEDPAITSVEDTTSGSRKGSFLGGDNLTIKGSGFDPEEGDAVEVEFEAGGSVVASEEAVPNSESEINVKVPNLLNAEDRAPEGPNALPLNVRVRFEREDEEGEQLDLESPVSSDAVYEALLPRIDSVTNADTNTDQGRILGGETLTIKGDGFIVPPGGEVRVVFEHDGEVLGEEVEATAVSSTELQLKAPSLAKYAGLIEAGAQQLWTDLVVEIKGPEQLAGFEENLEELPGEESRVQRTGEGGSEERGDLYEVFNLEVSSVTDQQTGEDSGTLLGGDTLKIAGSGFNVPAGGKATVLFQLGSEVLAEEEVTPNGSNEIEVTSPRLAQYRDKLTDGRLALDVTVKISDGSDEVQSPVDPGSDQFEALAPQVESVVDESTGTNSGSVLGGSTLRIKGKGLTVPAGGSAKVAFVIKPGELLGEEVAATGVGANELQLTVPNDSQYKDKLPAGKAAIGTQVVVVIGNAESESAESPDTPEDFAGDNYEFLFPHVESVVDESTGTNSGSVLGGSVLKIKGQGLAIPAGGSAKVAFVIKPGELLGEEVAATGVGANELQLTVPNDSQYKDKLLAGKAAIGTQVVVVIGDGKGASVESPDTPEDFAGDNYEFLFPHVESVVDESTGTNSGSVLGGSTLRIKGQGLAIPAGGSAKVGFIPNRGELLGEEVAATGVGANELQITVPDDSQYKDKLPVGKHAIAAQVVVVIGDGKGASVESPDTPEDFAGDNYEFLFPRVESVLDEQTGTDHGPILGGDVLKLKGSGLAVPAGSSATATFYFHEDPVSIPVAVAPLNATEVELTAPNLANFASEIPSGQHALHTDVILTIDDGLAAVSSPDEENEGNDYEALAPTIDAVSNETAGTSNSGSIIGGETLRITGSGFDLPILNSSAKVLFEDQEGALGEVAVTPVSSTEIELTSPDLAKYAAEVPAGNAGLAADLAVVLQAEGVGVQSREDEAGAAYAAELPRIDSVHDEDTDSSIGSVLGGDSLLVKGAWLAAPEGGRTDIEFRDSSDGETLSTLEAAADSSTELQVSAPDLSAEAAKEKHNSVLTDLVASVSDGTDSVSGTATGEAEEGDDYLAEGPEVSSVKESESGAHAGALGGGETLEVEGEGFLVPKGGTATVEFLDEETSAQLDEVQVEPLSAHEIELTSPDLSKYAAGLDGNDLLSDVRVKMTDDEEGATVSPIGLGDEFNFEPLAITTPDAADFVVGHDDEFAIAAKGGSSIELKESGALPEGVSFEDGGEGDALLSGKPAAGTAGDYALTITAKDGSGTEVTQELTLSVKDVPGAPGDVAATAGVGSAKVFWSAPSEDGNSEIESYTVTAEPGGQSATVDGEEATATVEHLTAGTEYTFSVVAANAIGEGPEGESQAVVPTSSSLEDAQSATSSTPGGTASPEPVESSAGTTLTASAEGEGTLEAGTYAKDPVLQLSEGSSFFDVATSPHAAFTSVTFKICGVAAGAKVEWYDPSNGKWAPASDQSAPGGSPLCVTVTVNSTTSPSLADLHGTIFAVLAPAGCSTAPVVETQPLAQTVAPGTTATFTASASTPGGCGVPSVQWYSQAPGQAGFSAISGATSSGYTTPATIKAQSGTLFEAIFKNEAGSQTTQTASLTVTPKAAKPLTLTPGALKTATATKAYSVTLTASGGTTPYRFAEHGALPEGLSWSTEDEASGSIEILGTPTRAGTSTVVVEASDASNPARTVRREFTLTVQLELTSGLGKATAGTPYEQQLSSAGGTAPYSYTLSGGSPPAGVHLSEAGLLDGTPTSAGTSHFMITIADASDPALTRTIDCTLTVRLAIEPAKLPAGALATAYGAGGHGVQLTAQGGSGTYGFTASGLPAGLTIANGLIAGTPTEEGTFTVTVEVTDLANPATAASHNYTVKVTAKPKR